MAQPAPQGEVEAVARRIAAAYAAIPEVEAVAMGGSWATGQATAGSDIDLYVYARGGEPALGARAGAAAGSPRAELGNHFFEPGDEWIDAASGIHLDVMFRDPAWIEADLERVLVRHEAWVGYSTAFWHNLRTAVPLFDRSGWYAALRARAAAPYPAPLVQAIVAKNQPLLRASLSSYAYQLERAVARADRVSVNHRVAAFLASVFDVLLAVNRLPHPGEKRLLAFVEASCPIRPPALSSLVERLLEAAGRGGPEVLAAADALAAALDALLQAEGLLPAWPA
ncbi:MAG: nucleotidyltransferase domain-containing protein [Anaeromyxobacter sp.]